jgi:hypothetical protein
MNATQIWIAATIAVAAAVALLVLFVRRDRGENRLTPLAGLAFGFVVAGLVFGEDRLLGYSLLGAGVVLAVADMVNRSRGK